MKKIKFFCFWVLVGGTMSNMGFAQERPLSLGLDFGNQLLYISFELHPDFLQEKTHPPLFLEEPFLFGMTRSLNDTERKTSFWISSEKVLDFLTQSSLRDRSERYDPVKISKDLDDQWEISGSPFLDYLIDESELLRRINHALNTGEKTIKVPYEKAFNRPKVDKKIQKKYGIHEVVAMGASYFGGSSPERIANIKNAAKKFDKTLLRPGEIFSFNERVGEISKKTGYVEENVIKGNETVKEVGGGVCEVSTAVFRSALYAGLPILERSNHSLALSHYQPTGLDAAIYHGSKDLRFRNDTRSYLLVQSFTDQDNVYFVLYGKKDQRRVFLEGPFVENIRDPRPWMMTAGVVPQKGYETKWIRKIYRDPEEVQLQTFESLYRPWVVAEEIPADSLTRKD